MSCGTWCPGIFPGQGNLVCNASRQLVYTVSDTLYTNVSVMKGAPTACGNDEKLGLRSSPVHSADRPLALLFVELGTSHAGLEGTIFAQSVRNMSQCEF